MSLTIKTNNVPRDVVDGFDLPIDARKEFDYINWEKIEAGEDSASFVQYKGEWYDLSEFTNVRYEHYYNEDKFAAWHGIQSDSFFSGILIRYVDDYERVIVGGYYS